MIGSPAPSRRKSDEAGIEPSTEDRRKLCRYIEGMTSVASLVEALHGAGSPQAQRIVMLRQADLERKTRLARKVIGIGKE